MVAFVEMSKIAPCIYFTFFKSTRVIEFNYTLNIRKQNVFPHKKPITAICLDDTLRLLSSCSIDGIIKIWSTRSSELLLEINDKITNKKKTDKNNDPISCCTFSPFSGQSQKIIFVTGSQNGKIKMWNIVLETKSTSNGCSCRLIGSLNLNNVWITRLAFCFSHPFLIYMNIRGEMFCLKTNSLINNEPEIKLPSMSTILQKTKSMNTYFIKNIRDFSFKILNKYYRYCLPYLANFKIDQKTGTIVFFGKILQLNKKINLFKFQDVINFEYNLPCVCKNDEKLKYFDSLDDLKGKIINTKKIVYFIDRFVAFPGFCLKSYELMSKKEIIVKKFIPNKNDLANYYRLIKTKISPELTQILLFFKNDEESENYFIKMLATPDKKQDSLIVKGGYDGVFLDNDKFLILNNKGKSITLYFSLESKKKKIKIDFTAKVLIKRVFKFKNKLLFYDVKNNQLVYSFPLDLSSISETIAKSIQISPNLFFNLNEYKKESLITIYPNPEYNLLCILTNERIIIIDENFNFITNYYEKIYSCLWVNKILLFNNKISIKFLNVENIKICDLCTFDYLNSVLVDVLFDRIIFCYEFNAKVSVDCRFCNIGEIILENYVCNNKKNGREELVKGVMEIVKVFCTKNVSKELILFLVNNNFPNLAFVLFNKSKLCCNLYYWRLHFTILIKNLKFKECYELLREVEKKFKLNSVKKYYQKLGKICFHFYQYNISVMCFEKIEEYWWIFLILKKTNNLDGIKSLAVKFYKSDKVLEHSVYLACISVVGEVVDQRGRKKKDMNDVDWGKFSKTVKNYYKIETENFTWEEDYNNIKIDENEKFSIKEGEVEYSLDYLKLNKIEWWLGGKSLEFTEINKKQSGNLNTSQLMSGGKIQLERSFSIGDFDRTDGSMSDTESQISESDFEQDKKSDMFTVGKDGQREISEEQRKKIMNDIYGSDGDTDSDEFEDDPQLKRRRDLIRKIKIKEVAVVEEDEADEKLNKLTGFLGDINKGKSENTRSKRRRKRNLSISIDGGIEGIEQKSPLSPKKEGSFRSKRRGRRNRKKKRFVSEAINKVELIKRFVSYLDNNKFKDAYVLNTKIISFMSKDQNEIIKRNSFLMCVNYRLFLRMLQNVQRLKSNVEANIERIAFISNQLALIKIKYNHQIICKNMSIKYNFQMKNYGIVKKYITDIIDLAPEKEKTRYEEMLKECSENGNKNVDNDIDNENIKVCWQSFEKIHLLKDDYLKCSYCKGIFIENEERLIIERKKCVYCVYGELELVENDKK